MARNSSSSNQNQNNNQNNNVVQDPSLNPNSPYFVHSSESPTAVNVSPQLTSNGDNYHTWARMMRRALGSKNKYRFVDGSIRVPLPNDPNFEAWERCNNLVHSWILNSLAPSVAQSVVFIESALDVWNDLKERFSQGDSIRVAELHEEISGFKQGTFSVSEYFTELRTLWEELDQYRPIPHCTCPVACVCLAMRNTKLYLQEDRVIRFLIGLNEQFQGVKSQILLMEPLPTMNRAFSMVIKQERQCRYGVVDEPTTLINAADTGKSSGRGRGFVSKSGGRGTGKVCTYCGKTGHTVEVCYQKHGYPPNFKRGTACANSSATEGSNEGLEDQQSQAKNEDDSAVSLTRSEYNKLVALLQQNSLDNSSKVHSSNMVKGQSSCQTVAATGKMCTAVNSSKMIGSPWILDTGATDHICSSLDWFVSYEKIKSISVTLPNGNSVEAHFTGKVQLSDNLLIENVLYLPQFSFNLISVSKLSEAMKCSLIFESHSCVIQEKNGLKKIGLAKQVDGLYYLEVRPGLVRTVSNYFTAHSLNASVLPDSVLWHLRLGHLSQDRMLCLNKQYSYIPISNHTACDICHLSRQKRLSFPISNRNAKSVFDLVHFDIWGPFSTHSVHGYRYFLTVLDDCSRHIWVVMMKLKSEASQYVKSFVNMVDTQFNKKVKTVRSDNGPEFLLPEFYASKGIIHQTSCVATPQQNGRVERRHQHILNVSRALMFQSQLPKIYWSYAVQHAVFLINRIPTRVLGNISPYQVLHGEPPDLSDLRVFGCLCYASTLQSQRKKFDPRAKKCVFLGYKSGMKGSIVLDINSRAIAVSRDVTFYDLEFPFHNTTPSITTPHIYIHDDLPSNPPDQMADPEPLSIETKSPNRPSSPHITQPRKSTRDIQRPSYLNDYVCNTLSTLRHPLSTSISYSNLSPKHKTHVRVH